MVGSLLFCVMTESIVNFHCHNVLAVYTSVHSFLICVLFIAEPSRSSTLTEPCLSFFMVMASGMFHGHDIAQSWITETYDVLFLKP